MRRAMAEKHTGRREKRLTARRTPPKRERAPRRVLCFVFCHVFCDHQMNPKPIAAEGKDVGRDVGLRYRLISLSRPQKWPKAIFRSILKHL